MMQQVAGQLRRPEGEMGKQIGERMNEGNRFMNLEAIKALEVAAGDHVLEIGMGNGAYVTMITSAAEGVRYTGCDFSETMIAEAEARNKELIDAGIASFILTEAKSLPFPDRHFDKVVTVNTVYFWEDPAAELAEIKRVLQPGGRLVMGIRPEWCMKSLPFTAYGFTMYSAKAIRTLLEENGFKVADVAEHTEQPQSMGDMSIEMGCVIVTATGRI
jgi:ubiquinone/menaquinone biosynthesis C-methylase UbiE